MSFILLVYNYKNSSSQTCSLKYQFLALENVSRGITGPILLLSVFCDAPLPALTPSVSQSTGAGARVVVNFPTHSGYGAKLLMCN